MASRVVIAHNVADRPEGNRAAPIRSNGGKNRIERVAGIVDDTNRGAAQLCGKCSVTKSQHYRKNSMSCRYLSVAASCFGKSFADRLCACVSANSNYLPHSVVD